MAFIYEMSALYSFDFQHFSNITAGGDGWLRLWEAETLEEAALRAAGRSSCSVGVTTGTPVRERLVMPLGDYDDVCWICEGDCIGNCGEGYGSICGGDCGSIFWEEIMMVS